MLKQKPEAPMFFPMPDRDKRRGELLALYTEDNQFNWRGAFWSIALCAGVVFAAMALKWAWFALGIPYPGR